MLGRRAGAQQAAVRGAALQAPRAEPATPDASRTLAPGMPRWHALRCRPRLLFLLIMLLTAMLTPGITVFFSPPEVRVEQGLALIAGLWLVRDWWRAGRPLRPSPLDGLFFAFGLVVTASILHARLRLGSDLSLKDLWEVVKLGLYWVLFRFGVQAVREGGAGDTPDGGPAARWMLRTLLLGGALAGLFGLAQYYNWLAVNDWATPAWAPDHHLRTLAVDARAVGTVSNPNYFGMLAALVLLSAVAWLAGVRPARGDHWGLCVGLLGLTGGAAGLVTSASRGATLAFGAGMIVLWGVPLLGRAWRTIRHNESAQAREAPEPGQAQAPGTAREAAPTKDVFPLVLATGAAALVLLLTVLVVEAAPRGRMSYMSRMARSFGTDVNGSLALRVERWRGLVRPWFGAETAAPAVEEVAPEPVAPTNGLPVSQSAEAVRDAQRKADVRTLLAAIEHYRLERGSLPPEQQAFAALVPAYLPVPPADPGGTPYSYERTPYGFSVAALLEDPADPDYPIYALGSGGNYIENASLEEGGEHASAFRTLPGTRYELTDDDALYGRRAARFLGNPEAPERFAALFQQRYLGRPGGDPLTAAVWVKLTAPIDGELWLYTNLYYADGMRSDPHARLPVDHGRIGVWQRLSALIRPEPGRHITYVGVYLMARDFRGEALVDGFELVDGSIPLSFPSLHEAPPSSVGLEAEARLRRSPLIGVGPRKAERAGSTDNEYLTIATRYGLLGAALYLALWGATFVAASRGAQPSPTRSGAVPALCLTVTAAIGAFLMFNLVAGSLLHMQLMAVFWPLAGVALGVMSSER